MSIQKWFRILNKAQFIAGQLQTQKRPRGARSVVPSSSMHADNSPHVELGWTLGEVLERYEAFRGESCAVFRYSDNPLIDEDQRGRLRLSDDHKAHCIMYPGVPRWGLFSTLYITFNESDVVVEVQWDFFDGKPFPLHLFNAIELELKETFGVPQKRISGQIVEWLWQGEEFEIYFTGTIGIVTVEVAGIVMAFTGYRDATPRQESSGTSRSLDESPIDIDDL